MGFVHKLYCNTYAVWEGSRKWVLSNGIGLFLRPLIVSTIIKIPSLVEKVWRKVGAAEHAEGRHAKRKESQSGIRKSTRYQ